MMGDSRLGEDAMGTNRPIFVLGCPRSGTTLLQLMLHAHPRIAIPPETRFLIAAYRSRRAFGDLREERNRRALAGSIVGRRATLFYDLGLDPHEITEEIAAGPPTLGSAFGIIFRAYARRFGKPRWGDKRPGYYEDIPALLRLFPDAQLVHLIRDGRDCVGSLKAMPWFEHDICAAIATWNEAIDSGYRAARRLPPGSFFQLRYEQLVAAPEEQLTALCAFLGEDYDPAMSRPDEVAGTVIPGRKTWHEANRRPVTPALAGRWRERLEPWEVALCESVMAGRLRSLGYEVSGGPRPPAGPRAGARPGPLPALTRLGRAAARPWETWQGGSDAQHEAVRLGGHAGQGRVPPPARAHGASGGGSACAPARRAGPGRARAAGRARRPGCPRAAAGSGQATAGPGEQARPQAPLAQAPPLIASGYLPGPGPCCSPAVAGRAGSSPVAS